MGLSSGQQDVNNFCPGPLKRGQCTLPFLFSCLLDVWTSDMAILELTDGGGTPGVADQDGRTLSPW